MDTNYPYLQLRGFEGKGVVHIWQQPPTIELLKQRKIGKWLTPRYTKTASVVPATFLSLANSRVRLDDI